MHLIISKAPFVWWGSKRVCGRSGRSTWWSRSGL